MIQQVHYHIPPVVQEKLLTGALKRFGGVVRLPNGRIFMHLKEISLPAEIDRAATKLPQALRHPKKAPVAAIVAGGVVAAGAMVMYGTLSMRNINVQRQYHAALRAYLDALRVGRLDATIIQRVQAPLKVMIAKAQTGDTSLTEGLDADASKLAHHIQRATLTLLANNGLDLPDHELQPDADDEVGGVVRLHQQLALQRRILLEAA